MEINELRDCTNERLDALEGTLRRQLFDARIKNLTNQLDDTASIRRTRRDLARVKTIISARRGSDVAAAPVAAASTPSNDDAEDSAPAEETK